MMTINEYLVLCSIGLFIGVVAVTSGGGATVGVPMVLALGHPAAVAVIAVNFGLTASFITGAFTYRRLDPPKATLPLYIWPLAIVGSLLGANLFLQVDAKVLRAIILLLLVAALLLTLMVKPNKAKDREPASAARQLIGTGVVFVLSVYCGFFGAGFGTFVILALMYFYGYSFLESASACTRFALVVGGASLLLYIFRGAVSYEIGVPLAIGSSVGGYLGAVLAQRGGDGFIRTAFIASTCVLILKLGYDYFFARVA